MSSFISIYISTRRRCWNFNAHTRYAYAMCACSQVSCIEVNTVYPSPSFSINLTIYPTPFRFCMCINTSMPKHQETFHVFHVSRRCLTLHKVLEFALHSLLPSASFQLPASFSLCHIVACHFMWHVMTCGCQCCGHKHTHPSLSNCTQQRAATTSVLIYATRSAKNHKSWTASLHFNRTNTATLATTLTWATLLSFVLALYILWDANFVAPLTCQEHIDPYRIYKKFFKRMTVSTFPML